MDLEGALASFVEALEARRGIEYAIIDSDGTVITKARVRGIGGDVKRLVLRVVDPPGW
jgi:hypothetical protein